MKNELFLILGYGIPRYIMEDENYNIYLKLAFNAIFDIASKENSIPNIIFCGGKTNMVKSYERTEAEEMIKLFQSLMEREHCSEFTKDWKLIAEDRSISTLENLMFAKEVAEKEKNEFEKMNLIFEATRSNRIKNLAAKIFDKEVNFIPFDFSQNSQRYLKYDFIQGKENKILEHDMIVLDGKIDINEHHKVYVEKLRILRSEKPENHDEAIKRLWENMVNKC